MKLDKTKQFLDTFDIKYVDEDNEMYHNKIKADDINGIVDFSSFYDEKINGKSYGNNKHHFINWCNYVRVYGNIR